MKVAIIGAGIAGLSCAHELEKNGIKPDIYERREKVGNLFTHVGIMLEVFDRPIKDHVQYLQENFSLYIKPLGTVNEIIMYSAHSQATVKGKLGYLMLRGQDESSLENQLAAHLKKSAIHFFSNPDLTLLSNKYDAVLVATGTKEFAQKAGIWTTDISAYIKGAIVLGKFSPGKIQMWVNTEYSKHGFAYLCPFSEKAAVLILAITEENSSFSANKYWINFLQNEEISFPIIESFELPFEIGTVFPHRLENIYFVGNAGGFTESFLGFGQFEAILSGIYAARSIVFGTNYEDAVTKLISKNNVLLSLRNTINKFTNQDYDKLVKTLGMPIVNELIYHSKVDLLKHANLVKKFFG